MFASDDSEDGTENVFDADCCNGIVAAGAVVVVPFWGESSGGGCKVGKDDVEGSEAAMDAGALSVSDGADCVSNSDGGTCVQYQQVKRHQAHITRRALGVACTLVMSLARSQ